MQRLLAPLRKVVVQIDSPWVATLFGLLVYGLFSAHHQGGFAASSVPYFQYLADAFLHGQTHLRLPPPSTHDLSHFDGKLFLYWSPFPAVLMMPFVAIWGVKFSDVVFTDVLGALNIGMLAALLRAATRRRLIKLSRIRRALLVFFFAFGTVHFTLAPFGRVWFTAQVVGFGCVVLAYWAAIALRGLPAFAVAGLAMTGALLTKNHMLATGIWPALYLLYTHWDSRSPTRVPLRYLVAALLPVLVGFIMLAGYNWLRFGNMMDNGYRFHEVGFEFAEDFARYGVFHPHFLLTNIYYQYLYYPLPIREGSYLGGSLFLMSPFFLAAFGANWKAPRWSVWALVASLAITAVPILLLMGTGFVQWGPRYTLDFTVPLLMLTAMGLRRWKLRWFVAAGVVSTLSYVYGALHFARYL